MAQGNTVRRAVHNVRRFSAQTVVRPEYAEPEDGEPWLELPTTTTNDEEEETLVFLDEVKLGCGCKPLVTKSPEALLQAGGSTLGKCVGTVFLVS